MARVKRGNIARKRRKKILQLAKGYRGAHSRLFRIANQQVMKALRYSYVGRKQKKRVFRKLWITRINAASRLNGLSYSRLINNFKKSNIGCDRRRSIRSRADLPLFDLTITITPPGMDRECRCISSSRRRSEPMNPVAPVNRTCCNDSLASSSV